MENNDNQIIIGYSAFILFDECYEYNENACYIADSEESLKNFLENATFNINDHRFDAIKLSDIIDDYGCSCGEYAMEPEALRKFKRVSNASYTVEPYDDPFNSGEPDLFIVNIDPEKNKGPEEFAIEDILESFMIYDGEYKRDQIEAAVNLKKEITPYLIEILENVLAAPEKYAKNEDLYDHIYAVMLLGHFKEVKAHKVIVDLFSIPGELTNQIFGDITTSNLPVILLNTCGGSVDLIKSMVLNKEVNDYCRLSACEAMAFAVLEGYVSRNFVIEFFETLFTGEEADKLSDFWGLLATTLYGLYPEELMDVIKQAYDDELIAPGIIQYSDFEKALELGKDYCLEKLKSDMERGCLDDIHDAMSWWACFDEERKTFSSSSGFDDDYLPGYSGQPSSQTLKNKKKAKKKKRKKAKASRKKNRR